METVNRAAIVVESNEPYKAWARSLDGASTIDEMSRDELTSIFLVNDSGDEFERQDILRRQWRAVFEEQLYSWCWPRNRTLAMFLEWFDVRVIELVYDLGDGNLDYEN